MAKKKDLINVQDFEFTCSDGVKLAGQRWRNFETDHSNYSLHPTRRILCLHGFLDNCRSFSNLAPRILRGVRHHGTGHDNAELVAIDFPGHGRSSHCSRDHPPAVLSDTVYYVVELVEWLKWNAENGGFVLIGHSMGSMVSVLYTGSFPEAVQRLVLLDGFGPDFERARHVVDRLRRHITKRHKGNVEHTAGSRSPRRSYPTLEDAIRTRQQTAVNSPGNQYLSEEGARELVLWAIDPPTESAGWRFRHDPRLYWPAVQAHMLGQAFGYWKSIRDGGVPTLWLRAEEGWPFNAKWMGRAEKFLDEQGKVEILPGSHHFHLDPDNVDGVAESILHYAL